MCYTSYIAVQSPGDVFNNGIIDATDIKILFNVLIGNKPYKSDKYYVDGVKHYGDVNGDKSIDVGDAQALYMKVK